MQNPKNLDVTQFSLDLALECYRTTRHFPVEERFGLTSQMRRAAVSVGSNIAEGCGRATDREFRASLQVAYGSASELEFQVAVAKGLTLAPTAELYALEQRVVQVKRMLSRLIVAVRKRIVNKRKPPNS